MRTLVAMTLTLALPAAAVERGYAPVNGLQMYYEIHGNAAKDGLPLVLLHGGGSTIETSFARLIPLVSRARQVIAFEQQGHGHTADVDRPFSFEQSAEDAVALLRHLHVTKADFFGYSNGVISRWRSCSGTLGSWSSCPAV
jgi:pimeloyl-ACP methyl ester carboxylesterase